VTSNFQGGSRIIFTRNRPTDPPEVKRSILLWSSCSNVVSAIHRKQNGAYLDQTLRCHERRFNSGYTTIVTKGGSYNGPRLETLSTWSDISACMDNPRNICRVTGIILCFLPSKILDMPDIADFALRDWATRWKKNSRVYKSNELFRKICSSTQIFFIFFY